VEKHYNQGCWHYVELKLSLPMQGEATQLYTLHPLSWSTADPNVNDVSIVLPATKIQFPVVTHDDKLSPQTTYSYAWIHIWSSNTFFHTCPTATDESLLFQSSVTFGIPVWKPRFF